MKSTFGGLNIVVRGLNAQQVSLDTVGHNISNANTDGYSRQSVNLTTSAPETIYGGNGPMQAGTGVSITSVVRARESYLDQQYWKENASLGYTGSLSDNLAKIEGIFKEPSDTGLQTTLDNFWKSWQSLGTNASDTGMRTVVRQRGVEVVQAVKKAEQQLRDMVTDANSTIEIKVGNINQITSQIADLNKQIRKVEFAGTDHANDLRDRRDLLVDQLTKIASVTASEDTNGNCIVRAGGNILVGANDAEQLKTYTVKDADYGYSLTNVRFTSVDMPFSTNGGELQGIIESRDSRQNGVKGYMDQLNTTSQFFLTDFNDQHLKAYGTDNTNGNNFFGDAGTYYTNAATNLATIQGAPLGYASMGKVYGANTTGVTLGSDYDHPSATNNWLDQLKVNPALFDTTTGLGKIAAKTSPVPNLPPVTVQQSNLNGGIGTFIGTTYNSADSRTYTVKATAVNSTTGAITGVDFSYDGGKTWSTVPAASITTVAGPPAAGQQVVMTDGGGRTATIVMGTTTGNKVADTYTFTVNQGNASGDNAANMADMLKKTTSAVLGNTTLDSYYSANMGALGVQSQTATKMSTNQTTLVGQITNWRQSISGVNMDEEMSNMIRFQKGYNAAARVLTTMDEMYDKLINGTGVVGR
ncbi:flagellar hook-associated protein FlgK [Azotosporobacter soli]|uniref:flagellar hook-associated protein FlgK n=1 Tax=Azotosporobacter soli TaxID=3055040 RepID=UPI0031FEC6A0